MNGLSRFSLVDDMGAAWLERLPASSVDALILDPSAAPTVRRLRSGEGDADDPAVAAHHRDSRLAWELGRVLARGRRAFWICESRHGLGLARLLERYGLEVGAPVIWDRGEAARGGPRGGRLRWILPVSKGRTRGLPSLPDLIVASPRDPGRELDDRMPEAVSELLVMAGSFAGQWLVEPFAQAPTLALTAARLGRSWWGASHVEATRHRIAALLASVGGERVADGPVTMRARGLEVGPGLAASSQLSFGACDVPDGASETVTTDDDGALVDADVRGAPASPDEVRTGAV